MAGAARSVDRQYAIAARDSEIATTIGLNSVPLMYYAPTTRRDGGQEGGLTRPANRTATGSAQDALAVRQDLGAIEQHRRGSLRAE